MDVDARIAALDQVLELAVLVNRDMDSSLGRLGLTPARTHLLWEVHHHGPSTQRVLADALGVTARNVTGLVDALEDSGHLTREAHPEDRRATLVTLTAKGSRLMARMQEQQREYARLLFADLSDRQVATLRRGLGHLVTRLRDLASAGDVP
jgi:DNA-binding MarR family transcriptional regulator